MHLRTFQNADDIHVHLKVLRYEYETWVARYNLRILSVLCIIHYTPKYRQALPGIGLYFQQANNPEGLLCMSKSLQAPATLVPD